MKMLFKGLLIASSLSAFASPAQAGFWWCRAINRPDSGGIEALISNTVERDYGTAPNWVENDFYQHLKDNGWNFNDAWTCVGPYDTQEDSVYAADETARDLQSRGWTVYFTVNRAWFQ